MKNFHLPLPDRTYAELRDAAKRSGRPATVVARDAIALWLRTRKKVERHNSIVACAAEIAGTEADFYPRLEAAAIEHLMRSQQEG